MEPKGVESGRTKSIKAELDAWYDRETSNADTVWIWGLNKEAIQELLDTREEIPFRCFLLRYILAVHEEQLHPFLYSDLNKDEWLNRSTEELLRLMESSEGLDYARSPELVKKITDLVFEDFVSNQFYIEESGTASIKIRGSVNRGRSIRGTGKMKPILWDKNDLLKKLKAKKIARSFYDSQEYINDDEMFAFAFGLHMDYNDISFFLKKAFRRSDFNLWNWKEFLLYLTYRYAEGNIFEFYLKLKEAYEDEANTPKEYGWREAEKFSTMVIQEQTEAIAQMIQEESYAVALDENGNLPERMIEYIREYKYLLHISKDYSRTIADESAKLLQECKKYLYSEAQEAKKLLDEDYEQAKGEKKAQGKVIIYYDSGLGLYVPEGTVFTKFEKKTGRRIDFISEKEVKIPPNSNALRDISIEVVCTKKEKKRETPEQQQGFIQGKSTFRSDNPYISEMMNKSYFKPPTKASTGDETYVSGKIMAKCEEGKMIPAGTKFYAQNPKGEAVVFVSVKDIDTLAYAEVWVHGLVAGEEASKGEITECGIPGWKDKFIKLENSKIGLKKKTASQAVKGGVLYNYLYQPSKDNYYLSDILDIRYWDKLARILEGTQLSSSKINRIEKKTEMYITRNDILTLSFLAYMSELETVRIEAGEEAADDYADRYSGFMKKTNEILRKCGYHELYAPNPYDALLVWLLTGSEAINAYRNLWSWYLSNKPETARREEA